MQGTDFFIPAAMFSRVWRSEAVRGLLTEVDVLKMLDEVVTYDDGTYCVGRGEAAFALAKVLMAVRNGDMVVCSAD